MKLYNRRCPIFFNKLITSNRRALAWEETKPTGETNMSRVGSTDLLHCSFSIWLSLKQLVDKGHFEKLRFWGKIFGTEKNYYVAEAEQNAEEEADDDEGTEEANENEDAKEDDDEEGEEAEDPLPKSTYKPPPTVPKEERGTGVNKYTYYVCNYRKLSSVVLP